MIHTNIDLEKSLLDGDSGVARAVVPAARADPSFAAPSRFSPSHREPEFSKMCSNWPICGCFQTFWPTTHVFLLILPMTFFLLITLFSFTPKDFSSHNPFRPSQKIFTSLNIYCRHFFPSLTFFLTHPLSQYIFLHPNFKCRSNFATRGGPPPSSPLLRHWMEIGEQHT